MSALATIDNARTVLMNDVLRELSEDEIRALYQRYIHPNPESDMAKLVARNMVHWANLRWQWSNHPCFVRGVWLNASQADPIGLLLQDPPARYTRKGKGRGKKRWTLKSISGWKPYQTPKIAGTREMKLLKAA